MRKFVKLLKEFCSIDVALITIFSFIVLIRSELYIIHPFYFVLLLISSNYRFKTYASLNFITITIGFIMSYEYGFLISIINATFFLLKVIVNCFIDQRFLKEYFPFIITTILFYAYELTKNLNTSSLINILIFLSITFISAYALYGVIKSIKYQKSINNTCRILSLILFPFMFLGFNKILILFLTCTYLLYLLSFDKLETSISILLSSLIFFVLKRIDLVYLLIINTSLLTTALIFNKFKLFISLSLTLILSSLFIKDFYLNTNFYQIMISFILLIFINPLYFEKFHNLLYSKANKSTKNESILKDIKNYLDVVLSSTFINKSDAKDRVIAQFNNELCITCDKKLACNLYTLRNESITKKLNEEERKKVLSLCERPYKFFKQSYIMKEIYAKEEQKFMDSVSIQKAYKKELENVYTPLMLLEKDEVDLKENLKQELESNEYPVVDIINFNDDLEIKISKFEEQDIDTIKSIISEVYQKSTCFLRSAYSFSSGVYTLLFTFKNQFKVDYSFVNKGIEINSGDYIKIVEEDHKLILALSDGMTHSPYASSISSFLVESLFAFLKINPDFNAQIKSINNLIYHKSSQESYATLDYLTIDLVNLNFSLFKAGSFTNYIYHNGKTQISKGNFPPLGILADVEPFSYQDKLNEGDILVFMSDGFIDEPDLIIDTILNSSSYMSATDIKNKIYNILMQEQLNVDDRTLCVLKIEKN